MESVESIASGGTVEALTLAAALTAALVSIYNAWRAWKNWSIDRRAKRFEDSLDRALDPDATTARVGVEQLDGSAGGKSCTGTIRRTWLTRFKH
ncbi:hypothetical protein [Luteipulveratus halotolerans]|uniref:hypothetical protein n=1 Tax=Luteipulveratus halotolerans TaxID=1631356 RepID=UPI0018D0B0A2|nr:hypothetical protein [Luteipulveratus halotolerans]